MSRKWFGPKPVNRLVLLAMLFANSPVAFAQNCTGPDCATSCTHCQHTHCPPALIHCNEGPPKIKFKCACPAPTITPTCGTPGYGYFQPCWAPFPFTPDCSQCPYPTPACSVPQGDLAVNGPPMVRVPNGEAIQPRQVDR